MGLKAQGLAIAAHSGQRCPYPFHPARPCSQPLLRDAHEGGTGVPSTAFAFPSRPQRSQIAGAEGRGAASARAGSQTKKKCLQCPFGSAPQTVTEKLVTCWRGGGRKVATAGLGRGRWCGARGGGASRAAAKRVARAPMSSGRPTLGPARCRLYGPGRAPAGPPVCDLGQAPKRKPSPPSACIGRTWNGLQIPALPLRSATPPPRGPPAGWAGLGERATTRLPRKRRKAA